MRLQLLKCPNCNANLEVDLERTYCYCQYCGSKIILDDEKKEITININENRTTTRRYINETEIEKAKYKDKEDKRHYIFIIIIIIIGLLLMSFPYIMIVKNESDKSIAISQGKICAGFYRDLEGEHYESVVAHFKSAGFKNIELIDLNDYGLFFWDDGKVKQISVAGNTTFDSTDYFSPDAVVVITHR